MGFIENVVSRFPGLINGFLTTDDWGTQQSAFISPKLWDEFFKPRYSKIYGACKKAGWHVWHHSCGKVNEIIPGLIEAGVNVLNLLQPTALGIEEIGRRFAGKVCFNTTVDIQHTLPLKDENEVRREAELLLKHWATPDGGLIPADYPSEPIGASLTNRRIMFEAFKESDPFIKSVK